MANNQSINKARALYYNLFANFFVVSPETQNYLELVRVVNMLKESPFDNLSAEALLSLSSKLEPTSNVKLIQEYDDLFYNPVTPTIRLTASFYDEGLESGKKRVEMLQFIAKTKIRRDEERYHEYEDSVGFIFAFLAELCELIVNGESEYTSTVHCIFSEILNGFVDEVAKEIYAHPSSDIYKDLMVVLHAFIEFERLYLEVSKPISKEKPLRESCESISEEEAERRARNKALKAMGAKNGGDESCPIDIAYDVEDSI